MKRIATFKVSHEALEAMFIAECLRFDASWKIRAVHQSAEESAMGFVNIIIEGDSLQPVVEGGVPPLIEL